MDQGFFFADPAEQDALQRRMAYAKMLLESGSEPMPGKYGGLASAGKQIAGALLARWSGDEEKKLSDADKQKYVAALAGALKDLPPDRQAAYHAVLDPLNSSAGMQILPQIMSQGFERQDKMVTPLSSQDAAAAGFRPGSVVERDAFGNYKVAQESVEMTPYQRAQLAEERRGHDIAAQQAEDTKLSPEDLDFMARQALKGDTTVFAGLGWGKQGAANRVKLRSAVTRIAKEQNIPPEQLAAVNAQYFGQKAEQRAIGTRVGAITVSGNELEGLIPLAKDAYKKLPRGQFVPFNHLERLVQEGTSSPEQHAAYVADFGAITAYARALNPQGVPRENDIEYGKRLLSNATSQAAHDAALDQMMKEAGAIKRGTQAARQQSTQGIANPQAMGQQLQQGAPAGVIRYDAQGNRIP